ncbi:MAG: uncharacterized protein H6R04_501 [Burkholderiaceae bacterium]|nr:uncharacterized protein [Burkholderiaceae bacterium]
MKLRLLFAAIPFVAISTLALAAEPSCLEYEPAEVTLTGKLKRYTFPGPPNFESVAKGDMAETGYYLQLKKAVCMNGNPDSADSYPQKNVDFIQLFLSSQQIKKLKPRLGKEISLKGTLFARHTGHHHAPLILKLAEQAEKKR